MVSLPEIQTILRESIPSLFNQAQKVGASHRKLVLALYKLQMQSAKVASAKDDFAGEDAFGNEFIRNLNKLLAVKKREPCVDRCMRFISAFVQLAYEKDIEYLEKRRPTQSAADNSDIENNNDEEVVEETVFSRFIEFLICYLLRGFNAKEKMVRLRCCQLVAMTVTCLGEMDEELYLELVSKLSERVRDKEANIRVQAAVSLSKLQGSEGDDEARRVTKRLLLLLHHDASAEVRRAVLLNIVKSNVTLPYILERVRDVDAINRKYLFLRVLPTIDFRALSIEYRERILSAGINDRDPGVRRACVQLLGESWLQTVDQNLLELIESLDVVDSPIADDAIKALFNMYPEIPENMDFVEEIWNNLTPETSFLIRVTLEYFAGKGDESNKLDEMLPEVLKLANYLSSFVKKLEDEDDEELLPDHEYVIRQLLMVTRLSDFPDELGRRHMLTLMRQMLVLPEISESSIEIITDILKKLAINERDFTSMMAEVVSDIRESLIENMSSDDEESKQEQIITLIKCLVIIKYLLQRCQESLSQNSSIYGLLSEYAVPAIQSSEAVLQEYGVECLALCCVLDKTLAADNIELFIQAATEGSINLCTTALKALLDLTFMFGIADISINLEQGQLLELFLGQLESDNPEIQALIVQGLAKLLYAHRLPEPSRILERLLVLYYYPSTLSNNALRQSMSYFFPAYCYTHVDNQHAMQQVAVNVLSELTLALKPYSDMQGVTPASQIAQQLVTWCDPRIFDALAGKNGGIPARRHAKIEKFAQMGIEALKRLFSSPNTVRKSMVQFLNRLNLDSSIPTIVCQQLFVFTRAALQKSVLSDMISRNILNRFEKNLLRILKIDETDEINIESWLEDPEMEDTFEFIASLAENEEGVEGDYSDNDDEAGKGDGPETAGEGDALDISVTDSVDVQGVLPLDATKRRRLS